MVDQQNPFIRNAIYIAGSFRVGPQATIEPRRFETRTQTSNLGTRTDRAFVDVGFPNVPLRHDISIAWSTLLDPGLLEHIDSVASMGQPFDVSVWKHVYEIYDGDGSLKTFYLQRRQAITENLPAGALRTNYPDYPTKVEVLSAPFGTPGSTPTALTVVKKAHSAIDTGDPSAGEAWIENEGQFLGNRWVTKVRLGDAPPDALDILRIAYLPLYKMVYEQEKQRQYLPGASEPRGGRLVEV